MNITMGALQRTYSNKGNDQNGSKPKRPTRMWKTAHVAPIGPFWITKMAHVKFKTAHQRSKTVVTTDITNNVRASENRHVITNH